jgi:hypothetical protein
LASSLVTKSNAGAAIFVSTIQNIESARLKGGIMHQRKSLEKCANDSCSATFKSLGEGELFVFPVSNPRAWQLPNGSRQKILWLCDDCCKIFTLQVDSNSTHVRVVRRETQKAA